MRLMAQVRRRVLPARPVAGLPRQDGLGRAADARHVGARHAARGAWPAPLLALPASGRFGLRAAPGRALRAQLPAQRARAGVGRADGARRRPRPLRRHAGARAAHHRRARPPLRRKPGERAAPRPSARCATPAAARSRPSPTAACRWCWRNGVAYALYRWEMNIRMAAVLGFVGAGGLGQMLYFHLSMFQQAQASTLLIAHVRAGLHRRQRERAAPPRTRPRVCMRFP